MGKYLDDNGLLYFWGKVKALVPKKTSDLINDNGFITQGQVPESAKASTTTPKANGTAAVGTETSFARGDHVHPSDTTKAGKATTLAGYGITDAYTKTEVDAKLTSAVKYKGTKTTYSELPTSGNVTGDMWNITNADASKGVRAGDNVVWNGSAWDVQSGAVDLSGCVQTADSITNAEIDSIVAS